jgi:hypothetical protein
MMAKLIFLILTINNIHSQLCGLENPSTIDDCYNHDSDLNYCCLGQLNYNNTLKQLCLLIPKNVSFLLPYLQDINLPGDYAIDVNLDCGNKTTTTPPPICGKPYPQQLSDCNAFNTDISYCCLFKSEAKNNSLCIDSKSLSKWDEELFGYVIKCEDRTLYHPVIALLIFVILIF